MKYLGILLGILLSASQVFAFGGGGGGGSSGSGGSGSGTTFLMSAGVGGGTNDAATASNAAVTGSNANSSTISAPAITTNDNGAYVITSIGSNNHGVPTEPGGPTQIIAPTQSNGYEIFAGYTLVATAGTLVSQTGSQTGANDTTGMSYSLFPVTGQTPAFTGVSAEALANATATFTLPQTPANGTLLISCLLGFSLNSDSNHTPTGTLVSNFDLMPAGQTPSGHQGQVCRYRWAHNESGPSYTAIAASGSGVAGYLINVTNITAFDLSITSASNGFATAIVGQDSCMAGASSVTAANGNKQQLCGSIQSVPSAGKVFTSFVPQPSLSGKGILYCTDHTAAWVTNAANFMGGSFVMPAGYDCANGDINGRGNASIVWPVKTTITLQGQGGGWIGCGYATALGSILFDMSTNSSSSFMALGSSALDSAQSGVANFTIQNMGIEGGMGCAGDGGGGDSALAIVNAHQIKLLNNRFSNFTNYDVDMLAIGDGLPGVNDVSLANNLIQGNWFTYSGGVGLKVECRQNAGVVVPQVQNFHFINNEFTNNALQGEWFVDCSVFWASSSQGDLFQNNYLNNTGACSGNCDEMQILNTNMIGVTFENDYFENDEGGNADPTNQNTGWTGATWLNEVFSTGMNTFIPTFNNGGPALTSCTGALGPVTACVTDASGTGYGGTAGTTYSHSGSALAVVQCKPGTGWVETGTAVGCI